MQRRVRPHPTHTHTSWINNNSKTIYIYMCVYTRVIKQSLSCRVLISVFDRVSSDVFVLEIRRVPPPYCEETFSPCTTRVNNASGGRPPVKKVKQVNTTHVAAAAAAVREIRFFFFPLSVSLCHCLSVSLCLFPSLSLSWSVTGRFRVGATGVKNETKKKTRSNTGGVGGRASRKGTERAARGATTTNRGVRARGFC